MLLVVSPGKLHLVVLFFFFFSLTASALSQHIEVVSRGTFTLRCPDSLVASVLLALGLSCM